VDFSIDLEPPRLLARASQDVNAAEATAKGTTIISENRLIGSFDVARYLNDVPFYCPYDCDRFLDIDDAS